MSSQKITPDSAIDGDKASSSESKQILLTDLQKIMSHWYCESRPAPEWGVGGETDIGVRGC